jgi:hypothetical protein
MEFDPEEKNCRIPVAVTPIGAKASNEQDVLCAGRPLVWT